MNEEKKITWLSVVLFSLLLTGMALEKQEPTKQSVEMIYERCPTDTIEPSKDSTGAIQISLITTVTIDNRRNEFNKYIRR